jgi:hypothetical protein
MSTSDISLIPSPQNFQHLQNGKWTSPTKITQLTKPWFLGSVSDQAEGITTSISPQAASLDEALTLVERQADF